MIILLRVGINWENLQKLILPTQALGCLLLIMLFSIGALVYAERIKALKMHRYLGAEPEGFFEFLGWQDNRGKLLPLLSTLSLFTFWSVISGATVTVVFHILKFLFWVE